MTVREYVERELGFKTRAIENPVTDKVGTTPTRILLNNPDRFQSFIVNLGAYDMYIAFTPEVSSTRGILVSSGGDWVRFHAREDGEAVTYEIWAVAIGGTTDIYVVEYEKR